MPIKVSVQIEGLTALRRLIRPAEELYAGLWRQGMEQLARQGGGAARTAAPIRSGKLRASIQQRVQKKPFPTWAAVRVTARNRKFPYPRLLEFSAKHGHEGWLRRAVNSALSGADRTLEWIGRGIAEKWRRG